MSEIILDDYAKPPSEVNTEDLKELTYEDFVSRATTLREVEEVSQWTQGDLYSAFRKKFGNNPDSKGIYPIEVFAKDIGKSVSAVKQYAWVSDKFPLRSQRETGLSWSHYRRAAGLEEPMNWINKSVENNWTVAQLIEETMQEQDRASVIHGKPCSNCEGELDSDSLHLRRGKSKWSFCSCACVLEFVLDLEKKEKLGAA